MVSEISQAQIETLSSRARGGKLWAVTFVLSVAIVAAAAVLSPLSGNLRRLGQTLARLAFPVAEVATPEPLTTLPTVAVKKSARSLALLVPPRLLDAPETQVAGEFLRAWRVSGPTMCQALRTAGIETSEWRAPSLRSTNHECYFQRVYKQDQSRPLNSIFLKVRGNAKGDIFEIRGKIVGAPIDADGRLDAGHMRIFETLVQQAGWSDLQDTLASIRDLRDVRYERFGTDFSFTRDIAGENDFNFMLVLEANSDPQARTRAFFATDRWVSVPDPQAAAVRSPAFSPVAALEPADRGCSASC